MTIPNLNDFKIKLIEWAIALLLMMCSFYYSVRITENKVCAIETLTVPMVSDHDKKIAVLEKSFSDMKETMTDTKDDVRYIRESLDDMRGIQKRIK